MYKAARRKMPAQWLLVGIAFLIAFSTCIAFGASSSGANGQAAITRLTADGRSSAPRGLGWSPKGDYIAYYRCERGASQLMVCSADGKAVLPVSPLGAPSTAAWSPDGKHIAYVFAEKGDDDSEARVYVWTLASGQSLEVARGFRNHQFGYGTGYGIPSWSPDSERFVCKIRRVLDPNEWRFAPVVFAVDGSAPVRLLPNHYDSGAWYIASWSPDSQALTLCSRSSKSSTRGIWVCRPDGSENKEIVPPQSSETAVRDPLWSPDGKWIAYGSSAQRPQDERGMYDLWLVRPDGSEDHSITHGTSDSTEGRMYFELYRWAPDSSSLATVGWRLDALGVAHEGLYLLNTASRALTPIVVNSRQSSQVMRGFLHTIVWDGATRFVFTAQQYERHGEPGADEQLTDRRDLLLLYDAKAQHLSRLIEVRPSEDGLSVAAGEQSWMPSWSSGNTQVQFTQAKVISLQDGTYEPDLYSIAVGASSELQGALPSSSTPAAPASTAIAGGGRATTIIPSNRRASEIAAALPDAYTGIYRVDSGLNALVVSAPDEATLQAFRGDVALLDQPVRQIMIDVLVTELTRDATRQLGLDWEYVRGSFSAVLPTIDSSRAGEAIFRGVGSFDKSFFVNLSNLEETGEANIRANPRVLARAGTPAVINIRRTDNFFFDAGTDSLGHVVRARSDISADIILKITPQVLATGKVAMDLDATVDSFVFGGRDELPDTTRRQAVTSVTCGDGESVIIGGLTQEERTVKVQKTPFLGDLPVLGHLFRHTNRQRKESTLVIFITPRVVATGDAPGGR